MGHHNQFPSVVGRSRCPHLTASIRVAAVSRCGSLTWSQTSDVCQEVSSVVTWWRPQHNAGSVSLHRPWKELSCFTGLDNYFSLIRPCQAVVPPFNGRQGTSRYTTTTSVPSLPFWSLSDSLLLNFIPSSWFFGLSRSLLFLQE